MYHLFGSPAPQYFRNRNMPVSPAPQENHSSLSLSISGSSFSLFTFGTAAVFFPNIFFKKPISSPSTPRLLLCMPRTNAFSFRLNYVIFKSIACYRTIYYEILYYNCSYSISPCLFSLALIAPFVRPCTRAISAIFMPASNSSVSLRSSSSAHACPALTLFSSCL